MIRWFRQYLAVSKNAFAVSLSDPVFLILTLCVLAVMAFLGALPTFNFGQELRLIRDQSMALLFIGGCIVAMLIAISVFVRDLQQGAISILMSRPVSGFSVIAGKWTGLAAAVAVYHVPATVAVLWVTRIAGEAGGEGQHLDVLSIGIFLGSIVLTLAAMGLRHYFFGGWFVWQASLALAVVFTLAFLLANFLDGHGGIHAWGEGVDWRTLSGCILIFLAELIFLALILPFAVRLEAPMVMGVGTVIFLLGMISAYLARTMFGVGWLATTVAAVLPNWQAFWISDLLAEKGPFPTGTVTAYTANCLLHTLGYVLVCLCIAAYLFNKRELSGNDTQ